MVLVIPDTIWILVNIHKALCNLGSSRMNLTKGVQKSLDDLYWLHTALDLRYIHMYKLIPLSPTTTDNHDSSIYMDGGAILLVPNTIPHDIHSQTFSDKLCMHKGIYHPAVWRASFKPDIIERLIHFQNPWVTIRNSDLEIAVSLLQDDWSAHYFDVRDHTILSQTNNNPTLFWQKKVTSTPTSALVHLLCIQVIHQRHQQYVACNEFLTVYLNQISLRAPLISLTPRLFDSSNSPIHII